jgi:hypothetical protein|nr:MAG TPA: hypothetical protein [Caudoviricetes sp.]
MISHRICFTLTKKIVGKSLEVTSDYINVDGFVIPRSQALAILNNSVVIYQDKVILDKEVSGTCDDKFGFSYVLESGSTITPLSNSFLEMVSVTVPDTQETVEVAEMEEGKDAPAPIAEVAPKKRGRKPKTTTTASQAVEEAPVKEEVPEFVEEDQEDDELENLKVEDDESEEGEDEVIEDIELEEEDSDEEELAEEPEEAEEDEVDADAEESSELEEFEDGEDEDTEDSLEDEDELEDEIFQLDDE